MSRDFDIMVAGHLCLDIIPRFHDSGARKLEEIMRPGKLVNVAEAKISTGGPVSNTGINMKTLGNKVCFCARVGDDELGDLTVGILRRNGNADGISKVAGAASSYTIVVAPPNIDRVFLHSPATNNLFCSDDLNSDLIARCRHFHFGYPPLMNRMFENEGAELRRVFEIAKEAGATTSCDMTLPDPNSVSGKAPWRKILAAILPFVDIFLPSVEESLYMLKPNEFLRMKAEHGDAELIDYLTPQDYSDIADELLRLGARMTSLKSGHRGFYMKTGSKDRFDGMGAAKPADDENWSNRELWAPAFKAEEFGSATGSGDSAIAGFLTGFLRGLSIEDSLRCSVCCGLQNVAVLDAVSGIKSWQETEKMLKDDLPTMEVRIDTEGWKWSEDFGLWAGPEDRLAAG